MSSSTQNWNNGHQPYGVPPPPADGSSAKREQIRFTVGETVIVTIDGPPKQVAGRFGDQWQYIFDQNTRIAWLDEPAHAAIYATGARDGDEVCITKAEVKDGRKKRIEWTAQLVQDEPPPQSHAATAIQPTAPQPAAAPWPAHKPATAQQPAPIEKTMSDDARGMAVAIRAAVQACEVTGKLYEIDWDKQDIRALATTIYISSSRQAGRA